MLWGILLRKCVLVNTISSVLSLLSLRFAFVEYDSHRAAAMARRKLMNGRVYLWGHQLAVDWAEPELEVDEEIMAQVRYSMEHVLPQHPWVSRGWVYSDCPLFIKFWSACDCKILLVQVKVLYVRNLMLSTAESTIEEVFSLHAPVERVKKIRDYAFVHFHSKDDAHKAMNALNGG